MSKYTEDSIQKLDPLSFTRLRSDTYLGSNENSTQLVREIITNCYDEFLAGNCSEIWVVYDEKENIVTIQDNGQGIIPNVEKDNGRTILEMVYGDINTSGKYDKSDTAVYKISTGAFGIGASLTNFLSHWLNATTWRNGEYETVSFNEGKFASRKSGTCPKKQHGVEVVFHPSEEFFRDAKPDLNALRKEFFNMSCVCAGLKIHFEDKEYYHPNGLKDLMNEKIKNEVMLFDSPFSFTVEKDRQYLDFIMSCTSNSKSEIDCFCNYSIVEAGTPISAVKSCITRVFNKWGKENGILEKGNLSGTDIQEGMNIIFNLASPNIRYDSQTKVRVTSTEDNGFINSVLSERLEIWLDNNPKSGEVVLEKAIVARKAAEAAKKARAAVKNKAEKKDKAFKLPTTLSDAWSKNRQKCELFICEGKSAASGLIEAKDSETQAVYGVRGKMLSVLKTTPDKIVKNQEINNILQALGLDYNPQNGKCKYDKNKLRYGKIIAAADAK
jgi:DNA gyrase subunit B